MTTELLTFRDMGEAAVPRWLRGFWMARFLFALWAHFDALIDWAVAAGMARFPSWCAVHLQDGLVLLGRERGIRRGFAESSQAYAVRLSRWRVDRKRRGNPYATLSQLSGYLTGFPCRMRVVNNNGAWYTREADGTETYHRNDAAPNWNWDGVTTEGKTRYWVIIYPPSDLWVPTTWSQAWGPLAIGTLGSTCPPERWADMLAIIREWNPPHAICAMLILAFDAASFDPTSTTDLPDGTWGHWGTGTTNYVHARLQTARYGVGL